MLFDVLDSNIAVVDIGKPEKGSPESPIEV